jgi:Arc/MetJ family transcription regulator
MTHMTRTTVDVDRRALEAAQREFRTTGLSATMNAALCDAARRHMLKDFDVVRDIDGTPGEITAGREQRRRP